MIILREDNYEFPFNHKSDLRERIFNNFILDISEFLNKRDKFSLRGINKNFNERNLCHLPINLNLKLKKENKEFSEKIFNLLSVLQNFRHTSKFTVENINIMEDTIKLIEMIITSNKTKIKTISIVNLFYETYQGIEKFVDILNELNSVKDFSITNIGNRDRLFIHLEFNKKILRFANEIKSLKIDNLIPSQIPTLIKTFPHVEELTIENSSIGDDITMIGNTINTIYIENQLKILNLSSNGFCSAFALKGIKEILRNQKNLRKLVMKGLWVKSLTELEGEFKFMKYLTDFNLYGAKYLFYLNSSFLFFNSLNSLECLNLSDCNIGDYGLESLLQNLSDECSNKLKELILLRNCFSNNFVEILIKHQNKLNSLEIMNMSFNQKISHQGLNNLLDFIILGGLERLRSVKFNNCGINLKYSLANLINFIFTKPKNLESIELYFCILSDIEYIKFIKNVYNRSLELYYKEENKIPKEIRLRFFMKLNQQTNKNIFMKTEIFTYELYKMHNLIIR